MNQEKAENEVARRAPGGGVPAVRARVDPGPYMPSDPGDYAMPELRLAQGQSKAAQGGANALVQPGMYYCQQTAEAWAEFPGVVLRVQSTRALFGKELGAPACASDDGVVPRPGGVRDGPCATCDLRQDMPWAVEAEERRKMCNKGFALLLVHAETGQPYAFRVHGSSVGPYRGLNTVFRQKYGFRPFAVQVRLTAQPTKNALGQFYVSVPLVKTELTPEKVAEYEALALSLMGVRLTSTEEEVGQPDTATPDPRTPPPEPAHTYGEPDDDLPF